MADLKTKPGEENVEVFLNALEDEKKKADSFRMLKLMQEITGESPKIWGGNMIGFGAYHYKYDSGREGDWFLTGFAPRKANLTLYIMSGFSRYEELMKQIGKHKTGKSCLYVKSINDLDEAVLRQLIKESVDFMKKQYNA